MKKSSKVRSNKKDAVPPLESFDHDQEINRLRDVHQQIKEKRENDKYSFSIHRKLRVPILWVLFFSIIGLLQKSIALKQLIFADFFGKYYLEWFASFGNFSSSYIVSNPGEILTMLVRDWYYFFLTGGIISLIWALMYLLVNLRVEKKDDLNVYVDDDN